VHSDGCEEETAVWEGACTELGRWSELGGGGESWDALVARCLWGRTVDLAPDFGSRGISRLSSRLRKPSWAFSWPKIYSDSVLSFSLVLVWEQVKSVGLTVINILTCGGFSTWHIS